MEIFDHDMILQRVQATKAIQESIAAIWVWEEKPVSHWDAVLVGMTQAKAGVDGAEATLALGEGAVTEAQKGLHAKTKLVVGLAKLRFRKDAVKSQAFAGLRAVGTTVTLARRSADDLAAAWAKADASGSYEGVSLADYNTLRTALDTATTTRESGRAGVKQAKKSQQTVLRDAYDDAVAWYGAATRVFPVGTETGALLRAQIPTK